MIRRMLFDSWAGILHVWTLLTIAAFFFFPVFLDTRAAHGAPRYQLRGSAIALALLFGPLQGLIGSSWMRNVAEQWIPTHFYQPFRSMTINLHLA